MIHTPMNAQELLVTEYTKGKNIQSPERILRFDLSAGFARNPTPSDPLPLPLPTSALRERERERADLLPLGPTWAVDGDAIRLRMAVGSHSR
ncbi:MAG: hypothetical protein HY744_18795 [Deltaproteobacteria bacterium]|nr:hypothetical protein [Deltaproteobacteria bacterium]